ncbi:lasso peptide biosynthesis B2 protein [Actinomycetes bacterium M1A6_2h]
MRAAVWTFRSCRQAKRALRVSGIRTVVPPPPRLSAGDRRGVDAVLRRLSPTCLERSLVLQRWLASNSVQSEVIIGVRKESQDFTAHAWLDFETSPALLDQYSVIHKIGCIGGRPVESQ